MEQGVAEAALTLLPATRGDIRPIMKSNLRRQCRPHGSCMKTHAIHWKSRATGTVGTGTKLFEKEAAEQLAEELNEEFPDIDHKAVLHMPGPVAPAVTGPARPLTG